MYGLQKGSQLTEAFVKTADKNVVDRWRALRDEIVLNALQRMIDSIQAQIDGAQEKIDEYPPGVSNVVKMAIDRWNDETPDLAALEGKKAMLEKLLQDAISAELGVGK